MHRSTDHATRCARLCQRVGAEIDQVGSISFARFMELALYEPECGYYTSGAVEFGVGGDFVTAPELTPLFAGSLARQCAEVLEHLGGGEILEVGAGSGVLARELLGALARLDSLPLRYRILERSPALRARQAATLQQAEVPTEWLQTAPDQPFTGLILANELFDALPCHRIRMQSRHFCELRVGGEAGHFRWQTGAVFAPATELLQWGPFTDGYTTELNLQMEPCLQAISAQLQRGLVLCLDYGYPRAEYLHPERSMGTLLCHHNHTALADPLVRVGEQDISASVDFTRLAEAGEQAGLALCGYASQAGFLLGCGIPEPATDRAALRQLLLPGGMGERFQVMALGRGMDRALCGFSQQDYRWRL